MAISTPVQDGSLTNLGPQVIATGATIAVKTGIGVLMAAANPIGGAVLGLTWAVGTCAISPAVDWAIDKMGIVENQTAATVIKVALSFFAGAALAILATTAIASGLGLSLTLGATLTIAASMLLTEVQVCVIVSGVLACLYTAMDCWGTAGQRQPDLSNIERPIEQAGKMDSITSHASRSLPFMFFGSNVLNLLSNGLKVGAPAQRVDI